MNPSSKDKHITSTEMIVLSDCDSEAFAYLEAWKGTTFEAFTQYWDVHFASCAECNAAYELYERSLNEEVFAALFDNEAYVPPSQEETDRFLERFFGSLPTAASNASHSVVSIEWNGRPLSLSMAGDRLHNIEQLAFPDLSAAYQKSGESPVGLRIVTDKGELEAPLAKFSRIRRDKAADKHVLRAVADTRTSSLKKAADASPKVFLEYNDGSVTIELLSDRQGHVYVRVR